MATIEELLVKIGVDPVSANQFLDDVQKLKGEAEQGQVNLSVTSNAGAQIAAVSASTAALAGQAKAATAAFTAGLAQVSQAADGLRTGILVAAAGVGLGLRGAISGAQEESTNLANANVILQFSTEKLTAAQQDLRRVADETGLSYQQVSAALFDVASAGFQGAQAVEITAAAARVAAPAGGDVATAFNAIATAIENFGGSADENADKLARIADITRGTIAEVSEALGRVGPVAAQFGLSLDEVGAAFAFLTSRIGNAAESTTALNATINTIIQPTEDAKKAFDRIGVSFGENAFQAESLTEKFIKIKKATDEGRVGISELFQNIRALKGAAALASGADKLVENIDKLSTASGRAQQALDDFFKSEGPQISRFTAAFGNLLTVIGEDVIRAIKPGLQALTDFIIANRELVAAVVEGLGLFALFIVSIAATSFAIKQLTLIVSLFNGIYQVLAATVKAVTLALKADTLATAANAAAKESAVVAGFIKFIKGAIALLATETATVFANTAAWVKNTAIRIATGFGKFLVAIAASIAAFALETLGVKGNTLALVQNTAGRVANTAATTSQTLALRSSVGALSLGTTALGVFSAALIGVAIGRFIDGIFGISESFKKTTEEINEASKALAGFNEKQVQLASRALESDEALRRTFAQLSQEFPDISTERIFGAAVSIRQRITLYEDLVASGKATAAQEARLIALQQQLRIETEGTSNATELLAKSRQTAKQAAADLEAIEKDLNKVLEKTRKESVKLRSEASAAGLQAVRDDAKKRLELLTRAGADELAQVRAAQQKIDSLRLQGATEGQLAGATRALEKEGSDLQRILDAVAATQANFSVKIQQINQKRIDELRKTNQEEIDIVRRRVDAVIAAERRQADEAAAEIERLRQVRADGIRDVAQFINQLQQEETRRIDPALAALRRLEQQAQQTLVRGTGEQARQAVDLLAKQINRLVQPTNEEKRALERLAEVQERLVSTERPSQETLRDLTKRRAELEAEITRLQDLRAKREEAAAVIRQNLEQAISEARQEQQRIASDIEAEQEKFRQARANEKKLQEELNRLEKARGEVLDANIKKANALAAATQRSVDKLTEFAQATAGTKALGTRPEQALQLIEQEVKDAIAEVERLEQQRDVTANVLAAAAKKTAELTALELDKLTNLVDAQNQATATAEATNAALLTQFGDLANAQQALVEANEAVGSSVDLVLEGQKASEESQVAFAKRVTITNEEISEILVRTAKKVAEFERRLEAQRVSTQQEVAASGL